MLKWKSHKFDTISNNQESLYQILAGESGKARRVIWIAGDVDSDIYLRVYRGSDQFVDLECDIPTVYAPLIPVDIPLDAGQILNVGFANVSAGDVTPTFAIGYEESGS